MAYVPGYSADVFISYAHLDDRDGWVTRLKGKLAGRLTSDLAGESEIWFDADRLRTGDIFKQEIRNKLGDTLMLLAVVSPSYLKSQFCREEELDWFLDRFGREVIQLLKVPLAPDQGPPLPGVHYEVLYDEGTGVALTGKSLDVKLNGIIWNIRSKMEEAKQACQRIYLAQPKDDLLRSSCLELKRALHQACYAVLPSEFVTLRTLDSKIRKWIEDAELSIHIRGTPADPLAERQLDVARQAGKSLIILDGPLQVQQIPDIVARAGEALTHVRRQGEVYFVYDYHNDQERARPLCSQIELRTDRKVILPQPGETYHKAKLQWSDGIVLFRGEAAESWFQAQCEAMSQAVALRRGRSVPEAWYDVRPGTPERVTLAQEPPFRWKISRTGLPDVNDLQPFFEALTKQAAASGGQPG